MKNLLSLMMVLFLGGIASIFLSGCQTPPSVIAVTGTMFGVEVSQNPATQLPQAKIGYNRAEFAMVNKNGGGPSSQGQAGQSGKAGQTGQDVPNVLMEFGYGGTNANSIYQRLAVGEHAVQQDGAAAMFLKDSNGNLSPAASAMIERGLRKTPTVGQPAKVTPKAGDKK
ncbi:MAG: hypothetical protein ACYDIC_06810 [Desulfobaccales bacterium]